MKYRLSQCCLVGVVGVGLLGCSTHPLPQDIARVSTVDIVRRIRCEAKEGMEAALQRATEQSALRRAHVERIVRLSTIGYDFKFTMSEDNRIAVNELTFEKAASRPGDGFKLTLLADLNGDQKTANDNARVNTRIFRVIDKLEDLHKARCNRVATTRANLIYPITGATGMAEVVQTYIELEAIADLKDPAAKPGSQMIAFSDELEFTTTFETGGHAELKLETTQGTFKLTKASLAGSARRIDNHKVAVSLARDASADPDLPDRAEFASGRRSVSAKAGLLPAFPIQGVRDKRLQIFLVQRAAVARNRVLIELERRRYVDEDRNVAARVLGQAVP
jgi:hypothetical protein